MFQCGELVLNDTDSCHKNLHFSLTCKSCMWEDSEKYPSELHQLETCMEVCMCLGVLAYHFHGVKNLVGPTFRPGKQQVVSATRQGRVNVSLKRALTHTEFSSSPIFPPQWVFKRRWGDSTQVIQSRVTQVLTSFPLYISF